MKYLKHFPLVIVLLIGLVALAFLLVQGLSFGPLHTDIEVSLVWIEAYGIDGFMSHYLEFNQRHLLAAPRNALVYAAFGHNMIPYHLILQGSRILEGAFLAGIVYQLVRRKWLAVVAGLALAFTPIRVAESFQSIGWGIETTLALLLLSTYVYILSLKSDHRTTARWLYWGAFAAYAVSILSYEAGIPWMVVNVVAGWFALESVPWRQRARRLALGVFIAFLVVFVFDAWAGLAPTEFGSYPQRVLNWFGTSLAFPALLVQKLQIAIHDGYTVWLIAGSVVSAALLWLAGRWLSLDEDTDTPFTPDAIRLIVLSLLMIACAVLVGSSNPATRYSYQDRITSGRAAGVMLLVVVLLASAFSLLRRVLSRVRLPWQLVAVVAAGLVIVGPGLAAVLVARTEAEAAYAEVEQVAAAVFEHHPRKVGKSNYNWFRIGNLVLRILFNYSAFPLQMVSLGGIAISLIAFLLGAFFLLKSAFLGVSVPGWTTIVVLVSLFTGINIVITSVSGQYVVRLMQQSGSTQSYYVKRIFRQDHD
jgi:hypothetical protein